MTRRKRPRRPEVGNVSRHGVHVNLYPDTHHRLKLLAARWGLTLAEAADRVLDLAAAAEKLQGLEQPPAG